MKFNLVEKLSIIKVIDEIIISDGDVDKNEVQYMTELMCSLDFDTSYISEARKMNASSAIGVISGMSKLKKSALKTMMHETAMADGSIHESETKKIMTVLFATGMINEDEESSGLDLSDIYFESDSHTRYENGQLVSGPHEDSIRAIKIENDFRNKDGYTVTIFNLSGASAWGDQVQMAPKPMKVRAETSDEISLIGYGADNFGNPFAHYGLTIQLNKSRIEKIILHMNDRQIDIEYVQKARKRDLFDILRGF